MEVNADNVASAVIEFYRTGSLNQEINNWLQRVQATPAAWSVSFDLLRVEKPLEVQYYAASTLHSKISRQWGQISQQSVALKENLLSKLAEYAGKGPKIVVTRLCLCVAGVIIHSVPDEWSHPIADLIEYFNSKTQLSLLQADSAAYTLLEILIALAEEAKSSQLNYNKKNSFVKNELVTRINEVLELCGKLLVESAGMGQIQEQCFRCLQSWSWMSVPLDQSEPLLLVALAALEQQGLAVAATDFLYSAIFENDDASRYRNTLERLLPNILALRPLWKRDLDDLNLEVCRCIVRLVQSYGQKCTTILYDKIVRTEEDRNLTLDFVRFALECTNVPGHFPLDENFSDLMFAFWFDFQEDMYTYEGDRIELLEQSLRPCYEALMHVLLEKAQYPEEGGYETWSSDDREAFRCYRTDISDTVSCCFNVMKDELVSSLIQTLHQVADSQPKWQVAEAVIFMVGCVAEALETNRDYNLATFFSLLPKLNFSCPKMIVSTLSTVGSLSEWISYHPQSLATAVRLCLQGFDEVVLAPAASIALKQLTRENKDHIEPFAHDIVMAAKRLFTEGRLRDKELERLMACVGYTLSVLPLQVILQYLDEVLAPHLQQMEAWIAQGPGPESNARLQTTVGMLRMLMTTLDTRILEEDLLELEDPKSRPRTQADPHPVSIILQKLMPLLRVVLCQWALDSSDVAQSGCDILERSLATLADDYAPFVGEVAPIIAQAFEASPAHFLVEHMAHLVLRFHSCDPLRPLLSTLVQQMSRKVKQIVEEDKYEDLSVLCDCWLRALHSLIKKAPTFLLENEDFDSLFTLAFKILQRPEPRTFQSSCRFFNEALLKSQDLPAIATVFKARGGLLVMKLLQNIAGAAPRTHMNSFAETLCFITRYCFDETCVWFNHVVVMEGFPVSQVTQEQKQEYARRLLKERTNRRKFQEVANEFGLLCRGILHTEYAQETSKSLLS